MTQKRKGKIKLKKRLLSILLTAVLLLSAVPLGLVDTAYAAETVRSGACGDNVTWKLTSDGTLTISGKGDMADYDKRTAPWFNYSVRSRIKSVTIEDGVTSVGKGAFNGCDNLTSVTIPNSVTSIGSDAFYYCDALTGVTIPDSVTTIGDHVFKNCKALTSVTISGSVNSIGDWAFDGCGALTDIYYGGYGTNWLKALGYNSVPNDVTVHFKDNLYGEGKCGRDVNWVMTLDGTLTISGTGLMAAYDNVPWDGARSKIKTVIVEDGVTDICSRAFYCCSALTSVTIPRSVTDIGNDAFYACNALTDVYYGGWGKDWLAIDGTYDLRSKATIHFKDNLCDKGECGENISWVLTGDGTLTISGDGRIEDYSGYGDQAPWMPCRSYIKFVDIKRGVTGIGATTFYFCVNMESIAIPDTVTSIGDSAFYRCDMLTSIMIPESVTSIGNNAFNYCKNLVSVTIPSGVTSISDWAFGGCTSLTSVTIPKSVTTICYRAFFKDLSLTDVYYAGTASDWAKITIEEGNEDLTNATLHCAKSAPAAPTVKLGNSATSGKPMLTWNAVEGAMSYRIYRSTAKGSGYSLLGTTTATSYTNTGAKADTTYYYRVKAVNDAGLSPYSNIVSGQVKSVTPKPSAPVVKIGHSAASGKPMLTWNAVSGATSYKVYRATSQKGTYSLLGTVTATSYTNTGAKAGTTYWYKVKAVNSAGESAYSNVVSGRATVTTLTMGHSSTSGKPQLTWKAVSGAASYKVYRATAKNGAYSVINTTKALTYTNVGAALGTTYYYKVEALNAAGKSMGFSAIVEGKVAPVLAVGYSSVSGKPQLTWKAVPGATEYQVYRSTQQNSGYSKINTTTSTSYVNTGAKAGTTYYYKIVGVKGTAVSDFSNIVSARPGK